jgi:hypothetical protein
VHDIGVVSYSCHSYHDLLQSSCKHIIACVEEGKLGDSATGGTVWCARVHGMSMATEIQDRWAD